jgi:hypothetical protein
MRFVCTILLCLQGWLFAVQTDFDVAVVGTSPTSMLEALYHIYRNEKVLIIEADQKCGGAWKSIDICGIAHADMGCHLIGSDQRLKEFFEVYFGCKFICLEHRAPVNGDSHVRCPNGFYFSGGCHELISKLESAVNAKSNGVILHRKLESIFIDDAKKFIELSFGDQRYTTSKLIITAVSSFRVDNPNFTNKNAAPNNYNHLYMLVEDPTPPLFTYQGSIAPGMSRAMNLTLFLEMPEPNLQLIVVQTHGKADIADAQQFIDAFKKKGLLTQNAKIIDTDVYIYKQTHMNTSAIIRLGGSMIEQIDTSSFSGMTRYIEKWKGAIPPLQERGREKGRRKGFVPSH